MGIQMTRTALAVDLGGTWMRSAIVENGELILPLKKEAPGFRFHNAPLAGLQDMFLREMSALVDTYREKGFMISRFAIGFPGPVKDGYVYSVPTLWGEMHNPYPLLSVLKSELGKKGITEVMAVNDVTAMGWSYLSNENRTFCIITVSSGIGNKIFHDGQVLKGDGATGGEIGHWYCGDAYGEFECDCGQKGHLGAVSSGRGAEKIAERLRTEFTGISQMASLERITTAHIVEGMKNGDALALRTLEVSVAPLAAAIDLINLATGVDKFIIVGGFALSIGEIYADALRKSLASLEFRGHFTEEGRGIGVMLGADGDHGALAGLGRMVTEDRELCREAAFTARTEEP